MKEKDKEETTPEPYFPPRYIRESDGRLMKLVASSSYGGVYMPETSLFQKMASIQGPPVSYKVKFIFENFKGLTIPFLL